MFIPRFGKTFAQLPVEVKNANSHRGQAARQMLELIRERWLAGMIAMSATVDRTYNTTCGRARCSCGALPPLSLYVHLPWCLKKCPYCDFNSHEVRNGGATLPEQRYLDALVADLEAALPLVWGRPIHSIFIGGGTPSLFSPQAIDRLHRRHPRAAEARRPIARSRSRPIPAPSRRTASAPSARPA